MLWQCIFCSGICKGILVEVMCDQGFEGCQIAKGRRACAEAQRPARTLGGGVLLINTAVRRGRGQGNRREALGLCHHGLRCLDYSILGNRSQGEAREQGHVMSTSDHDS